MMLKPSEKILQILSPQFETELYVASLSCLNDTTNKLRYNNFAYSLRELSRHFLHRLAPEDNVKQCSWFGIETTDGRPTRAQRIKYAIQGGMTDELLFQCGIDPKVFNLAGKTLKSAIDSLNKFTHINPDVFNLSDEEVEAKSKTDIQDFEGFVKEIASCRDQLLKLLDNKIEDHMIDAVISGYFENVDSLAPHYSLEDSNVLDYYVSEINHEYIMVDVAGEIDVTLQYGSREERRNNDGLDIEQSFPFSTTIRYMITEDFPDSHYEVDDFGVDTSSWEINPNDEL